MADLKAAILQIGSVECYSCVSPSRESNNKIHSWQSLAVSNGLVNLNSKLQTLGGDLIVNIYLSGLFYIAQLLYLSYGSRMVFLVSEIIDDLFITCDLHKIAWSITRINDTSNWKLLLVVSVYLTSLVLKFEQLNHNIIINYADQKLSFLKRFPLSRGRFHQFNSSFSKVELSSLIPVNSFIAKLGNVASLFCVFYAFCFQQKIPTA